MAAGRAGRLSHIAVVVAMMFHFAAVLANESTDAESTDTSVDRAPASSNSTTIQPVIPPAPNGINVQILDEKIDSKGLERAGYKVQHASDTDQYKKAPKPMMRDRVLERAGLMSVVQKWDHLDRDMLFIRARNHDIARLQKFYPNIPSRKLRDLKKEIENAGGGK